MGQGFVSQVTEELERIGDVEEDKNPDLQQFLWNTFNVGVERNVNGERKQQKYPLPGSRCDNVSFDPKVIMAPEKK